MIFVENGVSFRTIIFQCYCLIVVLKYSFNSSIFVVLSNTTPSGDNNAFLKMTDTPGMCYCCSSTSLLEITFWSHIGRASRSSKKHKITRIDTQLGIKLDPVA